MKKMNCTDPSLLNGKGVFPYSYLDSISKLNDPCLPSIDAFTNDLTKEPISQDDYDIAQRAWSAFQCVTLQDYLLSYLKIDTYLLADIFESFRKTTLQVDGI